LLVVVQLLIIFLFKVAVGVLVDSVHLLALAAAGLLLNLV
jgi:hypothetical protein